MGPTCDVNVGLDAVDVLLARSILAQLSMQLPFITTRHPTTVIAMHVVAADLLSTLKCFLFR